MVAIVDRKVSTLNPNAPVGYREEEMIKSSDETDVDGSTVSEADAAKYLKMLLRMLAESTKEKLYRSKVLASSCSQKYNQKKKSFNCRRNHQIYQPR
ncbi:hypothetical protein AALP_AAs39140U000500 [Arabis alpina]|uniref:Uncharacterized protein n=1 Tax=Arabis alpina TaxID=50452 RepID=A0A087FWW5_ARAAL|nr:hypothetical protein AALP_AAs39140U000500 [Arabis alpina]